MNQEFANDVKAGLTAESKYLLPKYFYDARGSWLFQQIMQLPEYYLTKCESDIITHNTTEALDLFSKGNKRFNIIDMGVGDGLKTKILLEDLVAQKANFEYTAIDLSTAIMEILADSINAAFPSMDYTPMNMDYFEALEQLAANSKKNVRKVLLFLGSNIGNFTNEETVAFLAKVKSFLQKGDLLIVGFDLKKRPEIIYKAYNDTKGTTAAFNLNLLHRINSELGGNFKPNYFRFYPFYNPQNGELQSYLVSQKKQTVQIEALDLTVEFNQWEAIHTELSKKYSLSEIEGLADQAGFKVEQHLIDSKGYFVDTVLTI